MVCQKIAQYSLRTYLYLLNLVAGVQPLSPWFTSNSKRVRLTVSSLSLSRYVHALHMSHVTERLHLA